MEDVLDVYHRPRDSECPVVCLDETSKQLIAETRVPIPAKPGRPAPVLLPEQRQGHIWPPQLAVHLRPVRNRSLVGRHSGWRRIQQRIELAVIQTFGQRPTQSCTASPRHVAMDRSLAQPQALRHRPLRKPLIQPQPQHLADFTHRQSLA